MSKKRGYLKMILFVILYFAVFLAAGILVSVLASIINKTPLKDTFNYLEQTFYVWTAVMLVLSFGIYLWIFKRKKENFFAYCMFRKMSGKNTLLACFIGIAMGSFTMHFISTSVVIKQLPEFEQYITPFDGGNILATLVVLITLFPIMEEILFRGLILNELRKKLPLAVAIIIQALIYVPLQPNLPVAIYAFVGFVFCALVYLFAGSIWASALIQIVSMTVMFIIRRSGFQKTLINTGDAYLITAASISVLLIIVAACLMYKANRNQTGKEAKDFSLN